MQVEVLKLGASMGRSLERNSVLSSAERRVAPERGDARRRPANRAAGGDDGHGDAAAEAVGFLSANASGNAGRALANIHQPSASSFLSLTPYKRRDRDLPPRWPRPTWRPVRPTRPRQSALRRPRRQQPPRSPRPRRTRRRRRSRLPRRRRRPTQARPLRRRPPSRPRPPHPPARRARVRRPRRHRPSLRPRDRRPAPSASDRPRPPAGASGPLAGIDRRIGLLFLAFLTLLVLALARATYLGSVRASTLQRVAATQQVSNIVLPAPRGTITDRDGVELAISEAADDIVADPYLIKNPVKASEQLAPLLGKTQMTRHPAADQAAHRASCISRICCPRPGRRRSPSSTSPGITLIPSTKRVYPRSWAASQVLGTVAWDGHGNSGLEYRYDTVLRGSNGERADRQRRDRPADLDRRRQADGARQDAWS